MTRQYSYWSQKDILLLKKMMKDGLTISEMANRFLCTDDRVRDRIRLESMCPHSRKVNAARAKAWREKQKAAGKNPKFPVGEPTRNLVASFSRPTPEMIEEAQRRSLAPRSITASFFGDPPVGFSALDRRQGA